MQFPGSNTMSLSNEAAKKLMEDALNHHFQVSDIRVTSIQSRYSGLEIDFTTDPAQTVEPAPVAPIDGQVVDASLD